MVSQRRSELTIAKLARGKTSILSHLMGHSGLTTIGNLDHKYSIQEHHFVYSINLFIHAVDSIS